MPRPAVHRRARTRAAELVRAGLVALALTHCASAPVTSARTTQWRPLFVGSSLDGWRGYRGADVPVGWSVVDGVLGRRVATGDLVSRDVFGDFELEWEWKVAPGGDAGVFYRGTETEDRIYWSGLEYQLQDDAAPPDGPSRLAGAGAVYGLYPARAGVVRPAGEWNASRIIARGTHVEHWLNGERLAAFDMGSPDWAARIAASKFARWPAFGRTMRGHLAVQGDHAGDLAIRRMRIRDLQ